MSEIIQSPQASEQKPEASAETVLQFYLKDYLPSEKIENLSPNSKRSAFEKIFKSYGLMGPQGPREHEPGKSPEDFIGMNRHLYALTSNEDGSMEVIHVWFGDMFRSDAENLKELGVFFVIPDLPFALSGEEVEGIKRNAEFVIVNGELRETDAIEESEYEKQTLSSNDLLELAAPKATKGDLLSDLTRFPKLAEEFSKIEKDELLEILRCALRRKWLSTENLRDGFRSVNEENQLPTEIVAELLNLKKEFLEKYT